MDRMLIVAINDLDTYLYRGNFGVKQHFPYNEVVARYLHWYLDHVSHVDKRMKDEWFPSVPEVPIVLNEAFDTLRTSKMPKIVAYRQEIERLADEKIPCMLKPTSSPLRSKLVDAVEIVTGSEIFAYKWWGRHFKEYVFAQDTVLRQYLNHMSEVVDLYDLYEWGIKDTPKQKRLTVGSVTLHISAIGGLEPLPGDLFLKLTKKASPKGQSEIKLFGHPRGNRCGALGMIQDCGFDKTRDILQEVTLHWPNARKTLRALRTK